MQVYMKRIDAILTHRGLGSRSEVRKLLKAGRITANGELIRQHGHKIPDNAIITLDGNEVALLISEATLIMHKPVGYSCSHDEREQPLMGDLIPAPWDHLHLNSAGRLDRATSGLLILSTDGQLLHRLSHPKRGVWKRYRITFSGRLTNGAIQRCAEGLILSDEPERPCRPAKLSVESDSQATMWIHEGRYHQVRRMIKQLGAEVTALHRDHIGGLALPNDLSVGQVRELTVNELETIMTIDPFTQ